MLDKSLASPRDQFFQSFRNLGDYARRPQGAAVIGSIALHGLAAATIPLWASFDNAPPESQERSVVRVVDLPPEVQNRLPSTTASLDLSIFEASPDFNLDLSGLSGQGMDPNGTYITGLNTLPTPMAPSLGQDSFSFIPLSPPPISSSYTGFAPPPPPRNMSFLPPPPNVPNQTSSQLPNAPTETERGALPSLTPPRPNGNSGQQQQFTIPTKPDPELVERQRRLEEEAAIALQPRTNNPNRGEVYFDADLLKPRELRNNNGSSNSNGNSGTNNTNNRPPTPSTNTPPPSQTAARNTAAVNRSLTGNYPKGACSSQASGTATYNVTVSPEGSPSQWNLVQSSGTNALDNQASQDIRNARFDGKNSNYRVSVNYRYEPAFCAAFMPKPQPAPTNSTNSTPANPPAPARTTPKAPEASTETEAIAPDENS
ncbi:MULTISPECIES: TonB family protein [Cyanophyceae]|uniref:TonB family protein n=1 Tax=Cyanophyceae TaxID=3028117 RepID=UPI00016DC923|nr:MULTISPECIES: TonB family protein [Cyanophyceae]ACB00443.1 TonB family protein [Picosynechococcus sp. PCC 7002]SMH49420.1 TonB family C-terminal domain-containing protein [Picosynechococcus sp. OG1]SMQ81571.1 TonB family C-terminal domain-containing protein [Synechococcus sp. 7002]